MSQMWEGVPKKLRKESALTSLSDVDFDHVSQRQRLRQEYTEEVKLQLESQIVDLEENLAINKSIISELASGMQGASKNVILSLNKENSNLQAQLKTAIKQRDNCRARLLIAEQMVEEGRTRESAMERQLKCQKEELKDQLDKKEYSLQAYDQGIRRAVKMLNKYSAVDHEIRLLAKEFNVSRIKEKKITNLLDENIALSTEVRNTKSKMVELETRLTEIVKNGVSDKSFQGWKHTEPIKLLCRKTQPTQGSKPGAIKADVQVLARENEMLRSKRAQLTEEVQLLREKLSECTKKNEELLALVFEMKKEQSTQKQSTGNVQLDDSFNNVETKVDESFGAMSSIRAEAVSEFFENS